MEGKITRIQVLWVDDKNPNKVFSASRVFFLLEFSFFCRFDSNLGRIRSIFVVIVRIHNTASWPNSCSKKRSVQFQSNCTETNIISSK